MDLNEFMNNETAMLSNDIDEATLQANYEDMMASVANDEPKPKKRKIPRAQMSPQELAHHRELDRLRKRISRSKLSEEQAKRERERNKEGKRMRRMMMSDEAKQQLREKDRLRRQKQRHAQRGIHFSETGAISNTPTQLTITEELTEGSTHSHNAKQDATSYIKETFKGMKMIVEADNRPVDTASTSYEPPSTPSAANEAALPSIAL